MTMKTVLIYMFCALLIAATGCPKASSGNGGSESPPLTDNQEHVDQDNPTSDDVEILPSPAEAMHGVTPVASVGVAKGMVPFAFGVLPQTSHSPSFIWVLSTESELGPGVHLVYGTEPLDYDDAAQRGPLNLMIWKPPTPPPEPGWSEHFTEGDEIPALSGTRPVKVGGLEAVGNETAVIDSDTLPGIVGAHTEPAYVLWYDGEIQYKLQGTFQHKLSELIELAMTID